MAAAENSALRRVVAADIVVPAAGVGTSRAVWDAIVIMSSIVIVIVQYIQ